MIATQTESHCASAGRPVISPLQASALTGALLFPRPASSAMRNAPAAPRTGFDSCKAHTARDAWLAHALFTATGCFSLLIGLLVYLTERDASQALLIPAVSTLAGVHIFGVLGQWLPSFVHPFAFSLFSAAALPTSGRPRYLACVVWFGINVAFEFGQYPRFSGPFARAIQDAFGSTVVTRPLANYFVRGTFDSVDILAAALGALAAAGVLCVVQRRLENRRVQ